MYDSPSHDRRRSPTRRDRRDFPPRRRRSFSRERYEGNRGRRSPPPGLKRFRRDEDYYDRHDRGSPYRRGGYDREREMRDSHDRYHDRRDGPESYRDFILNLPNSVTPEEAHRRYQDYLTEWHGSLAKAEFEQCKDEEWTRLKYDPRRILQIIDKHKEHAQKAVKEFSEAMKAGNELDVASEDFDQGVPKSVLSEAKDGGAEAQQRGFNAPAVCWSKDRIESDWKLSTELVQKLDAEKEITTNPILTDTQNSASVGLDKPVEEEGDTTEKKEEEENESKEADDMSVKRLDLLLTYLWRVHMVDYYSGMHFGGVISASGHELSDKEYEDAKCRMLRPPKDHTSAEETDKRMLEELKVRVDGFWSERIKKGDPLQLKRQTERVEKGINDFIEAQVVQIDSKKWGNKLSSKMFVGKEFVVKHIRLKHIAVLDSEREKILDEIYYDNFRKDKEEQERKMAAERERTLQFSPRMIDGSFNGYNEGLGHGAPGAVGPQGMIGGPMLPGPMMGAPMGQMLMPAPGAGPMGPFVLQSVPSGGGMAPMEMTPMTGGGGAGRGDGYGGGMTGAGRFGASGGGVRPWGGQREYYDLDAPQNNRAVLDYGDL